jgi:hypothetical protein
MAPCHSKVQNLPVAYFDRVKASRGGWCYRVLRDSASALHTGNKLDHLNNLQEFNNYEFMTIVYCCSFSVTSKYVLNVMYEVKQNQAHTAMRVT